MDSHNEVRLEQSLLPRFTIRVLLAALTLFAVVFVIAGMAYRGQFWAWGVTIGFTSLLVVVVVHAAWFGVCWLFARVLTERRGGE
jgi:hypothetical protein